MLTRTGVSAACSDIRKATVAVFKDKIKRSEYPRPQLVRSDWLFLNGEWEFEIDNTQSGTERGIPDGAIALKTK